MTAGIFKNESKLFIFLLIMLVVFSCETGSTEDSNTEADLTPIARIDVVPHQRINYGDTFNFGVVAFSEAGIDRVEFDITGQSYSGGIKTAAEMIYNPRTDGYEYWVPISASEFSDDGVFTVRVGVYGADGGLRDLGSLTLRVESTGAKAAGVGKNATIINSGYPYSLLLKLDSLTLQSQGSNQFLSIIAF